MASGITTGMRERAEAPAGLNVRMVAEGAVLFGLFGALVAVAMTLLPAGSDQQPPGTALHDQRPTAPRAPAIVASHPETHLVIVVDADTPLAARASYARELDAAMEWVVSIEVVEVSEESLRGLEEALRLAAGTCPMEDCPAMAVLDLRERRIPPGER